MIKSALSFLFALCFASFTFGQPTTAMDWTKDDCQTEATHHLYEELEAGYVIVCEYAMNCATCISAANYLNDIYLDYEESHPGRVKFYIIDWNTDFTCTNFQDWAAGLSATLFLDGYDEVVYYGGMGMPTVVILGGADHLVYYDKLGYSNYTDEDDVRAAIDAALEDVTGIENNIDPFGEVNVYPNPSNEYISISFTLQSQSAITINLFNQLGECVGTLTSEKQLPGSNQMTMNTSGLPDGFYFIHLSNGVENQLINFSVLH